MCSSRGAGRGEGATYRRSERGRLVRVVVLGDRDPKRLTHREIDAALSLFPAGARTGWTTTDDPAARRLEDACGVWLLPGSPYRDAAAADAAIRHCLAMGTPFLVLASGAIWGKPRNRCSHNIRAILSWQAYAARLRAATREARSVACFWARWRRLLASVPQPTSRSSPSSPCERQRAKP